MARLALRQFLRSSFDPGDKTMASPIIACLGAATLLILASCSFTTITAATDLDDHSEEDRVTNILKKRVRPVEPEVTTNSSSLDGGYVRRSMFAREGPDRRRQSNRQMEIGSRAFRGRGYRGQSDTEDYADVSVTAASLQIDMAEDFDQSEINEYEDPATKTYHCCSVHSPNKNETLRPNLEMIKFLDDNGLASIRPKKNYYQVRSIRQRMCQFGFDPFNTDIKSGSIHKRFKNTLRLMIYNTPGIFPGLKVIRNDLDRKRKREPQTWFKFETRKGPLISEFDYDNYFITISGDFSRIQAYSKMLVALKMHKRLNSFNNSVSYKINLDLGILEVIFSSFGIAIMKEKSTTNLMIKALNGLSTEIRNDGEVRLGFEESLKDAADQVDPLLYSSIWLLSMAEKYEIVKIRYRTQSGQERGENRQESP